MKHKSSLFSQVIFLKHFGTEIISTYFSKPRHMKVLILMLITKAMSILLKPVTKYLPRSYEFEIYLG